MRKISPAQLLFLCLFVLYYPPSGECDALVLNIEDCVREDCTKIMYVRPADEIERIPVRLDFFLPRGLAVLRRVLDAEPFAGKDLCGRSERIRDPLPLRIRKRRSGTSLFSFREGAIEAGRNWEQLRADCVRGRLSGRRQGSECERGRGGR